MKIIVESAAKSMIFSSDMHGKILIYWRCPHGKEWLAIGEHGEIFIPGQRGGGETRVPRVSDTAGSEMTLGRGESLIMVITQIVG